MKQINKFFFKISVQVYSVSGQTKGRGKAFWNGEKHSLIKIISYMGEGVMLTIMKVFIILFLLEGIGNILEIFKITQSALLSMGCPGIFPFGPNWRRKEDLFWGLLEGGPHYEITPISCHKRWKRLSFCEIWNNPTTPLFFIRLPYK